jgi:hypothetical protein
VSCPSNATTFTGAAVEPCSATYAGAGGLTGSLTPTYSDNINAGTASANASYGGDANHETGSGSATFEIGKAGTTVTVSCPSSATPFTGSAIEPCSASYAGTGGLTGSLTPGYSNNVNVGTASANASYAGDDNHDGSSSTTTFTIAKAASSVAVTGGTFPYDGSAHGATAVVSGVGAGVTQTVVWSYSGTCATAPATVTEGTQRTARADYAGDANHAAGLERPHW